MSIAKCVKCGKSVQVQDAGARPDGCCVRGPSARILCKDCQDLAKDFPQYHLRVDGIDQWLPLAQAGTAYHNRATSGEADYRQVELGEWVIEKPGAVPRRMTDQDQATVRRAAQQD